MKKHLVVWSVILLTVINVASLSTIGYNRWFAGHDDSDRRSSREDRRRSFDDEMGLTTDQVEKRDAMRKALGDDIRPLREALKVKQESFYQILSKTDSRRTTIDSLRIHVDSLEIEIKKRCIDDALAQKEILTPEQQKKLFSVMRKRYGNGSRRRN